MGKVKRLSIDMLEHIHSVGESTKMDLFMSFERFIDWHSFKVLISMLISHGMIKTSKTGIVNLTKEGHDMINCDVHI